MSLLFARLRARRDASIQRHVDRALAPIPAPEPERTWLFTAAQERTRRAEDATRAMSTHLDAALNRAKANAHTRDLALAANVELERRVRELGQEVVALRHLLERAQAPRGTDRRCSECHNPMPWGTAHYCLRQTEPREDVAA